LNSQLPYFLITIDTEGDNIWQKSDIISTDNAKYLLRFQKLSEKYFFKPTYLTNYEMANSKVFSNFAKDVLANNTAEIGMHLHAWSSPPHFDLTNDDQNNMPFLIEYPEEIIYNKVELLTNLLEDQFGTKMQTHRAGRWAFNEKYAQIINNFGYIVDCSVIPHIILDKQFYNEGQLKSINYNDYSCTPYFVDLNNLIKTDPSSSLLEIPLSSIIIEKPIASTIRQYLPRGLNLHRLLNRFTSNPHILRPNGQNLNKMVKILDYALQYNFPCVEFMLHSSELMPGGSPYFTDKDSIEKLYNDIEILFQSASKRFKGVTCKEFYFILFKSK